MGHQPHDPVSSHGIPPRATGPGWSPAPGSPPVPASPDAVPSDAVPSGAALSPDERLAGAVGVVGEVLTGLGDVRGSELCSQGLGEVLVGLLRVRRQVEGLTAVVAGRFAHGQEWSGDGARDAQAWLRGQGNEGVVSVRGVFTGARVSERFAGVEAAW